MTNREFFAGLVNGTIITKSKDENGTTIENERSIFTENGFELTEEVKEFAANLIKKLDDKNNKRSSTKSAKQTDNDNIKNAIIERMESGEKFSAKTACDTIDGITSTQHATALFKQLVDNGLVKVSKEKFEGSSTKVNVYSLVETETDSEEE